jgi:hypothetical protein
VWKEHKRFLDVGVNDLYKIREDFCDFKKSYSGKNKVNTVLIGSRSLLWKAFLEIFPVSSNIGEWRK